MWFGTKDGLNRFDGYRFKTIDAAGDDSNLSKTSIASLTTDKNGTLWVGSQKGLYRFDEEKEKLVRFIDSLRDINEVFIARDGQLWFISAFSVCRYNFEKKQLTVFPQDKYFYAASTICQTADGTMWFATIDGYLKAYNANTNTFASHDIFSHSPTPASRWIEKILPGNNNTIYIGTSSQGLKLFDQKENDYKELLTYNSDKTTVYVRDILRTSTNEFWLATESGIFILNTSTGEFTNIRKKFLDPYSLTDNAIYTLQKDTEGGIWAGTYFGGINYYPKQYASFQKYFPDYTNHSISGSAVREICEDAFHNIWIATEDAGLNKMDPNTGQFTHFMPTGIATDISYSNVHGLLVVKNDLWVGTFEHGLDIMDIRTGKVKKHYISGTGKNDLKSNFIVTLLQTTNGDIYIGTSNGLFKYNAAGDNFSRDQNVLPYIFVSGMLQDRAGNIWVSTSGNGVFYFNPSTKEKHHFINQPTNKNSLTTDGVNAIFEDSHSNIWIATEGGGICRLSSDRKQFERYTAQRGLPSNFIFKILEDNNRDIWATTSKGLVKLDRHHNDSITVYTKDNGLLNDQFNYNSGYKDSAGKMYFGSVRGMITFDPAGFRQMQFMAPVYLTGFQVNNKELETGKDTAILKKSIVVTDHISLPYDQSSFSIDFAATSYTSPDATAYSYMMRGLDKDWTYIKSNRKVYFTNLAPGNYVFKVKAAVNGKWSKTERRINIEILPPFYATWWAYLIYCSLMASLLFYLIRTYHNRLMNKKEKEIYEAKIEFFTNVAHEIKTPLTLIKGPVENLSEMVNDIPEIKDDVIMMERNTNRLVNLTNQILDFRLTETKGFSLDFSKVNVTELLQEMYGLFEPPAKKKNLHYTIDYPTHDLYILADQEALIKIFSNLFSNAVKYAVSEVHICMIQDKKNNELVVEISNDGFLIPDELKEKIFEPFYRLKETIKQKGTGIGLSLARSLTELHHGRLFLKDPQDGMNTFVLNLPENDKRKETDLVLTKTMPAKQKN